MSDVAIKDYSLIGDSAKEAVEKGLAEADWYTSPVSRSEMKSLLTRRDWPAVRDTLIWFGLLIGFGVWGFLWWGSWMAIIPFACYGLIYASSSDSRWHESSHGTAFKSDWLNVVLYEIASFMVLRESTPWRWSHTRHHSDTIIVGRDPEIAVPRPPDLKKLFMSFFNLQAFPAYIKNLIVHSLGRLNADEKTYIPEDQQGKIFIKARIYLAIYATVIGLAIYFNSFLPLMYIGLPNLYGAWLMPLYGYTQHAGLAENVLDHRLNCRTVYMNPVNRFLYWNMNYHLEHHMFPLVPYHQLPKLHELIKEDSPKPYNSLYDAYKEIIPTVLKQVKEPSYYVKRKLPVSAKTEDESGTFVSEKEAAVDGWIEVCDAGHLGQEDVIRFDHKKRTYALYQTKEGGYHATDGICTHGNTHLAEGLVKGKLIECPKHNGRFDFTDGSPVRKPVCVALRTYPVKLEDGMLWINTSSEEDESPEYESKGFKVVSNRNVATFIRELTLEPVDSQFDYKPGDYFKLEIPEYQDLSFADIEVSSPYDKAWEKAGLRELKSKNEAEVKRNYSFASNPSKDKKVMFNIRIALPPKGEAVPPGVGSSYVFHLKPGDRVSAIGPFGDFHIKETEKEMIYLGGGAGMAPLRSHISYLLESEKTSRKISFWYGARSEEELFYDDYFSELSKKHENFSFHVALSESNDESNHPSGFIHELLLESYLAEHEDVTQVEFYICGPPAMMKAAIDMLHEQGVDDSQIAFDDFS